MPRFQRSPAEPFRDACIRRIAEDCKGFDNDEDLDIIERKHPLDNIYLSEPKGKSPMSEKLRLDTHNISDRK